MSDQDFATIMTSLHLYLESAIPTPIQFKSRLVDFISGLNSYLDLRHPHFVHIDDGASWIFCLLGTYQLSDKSICLDLVSYLDLEVVRFLPNSSSLKFRDAIPESSELSTNEKICLYTSERYALPFSSLLHPGRGKYYSQRLLSLIDRTIILIQDKMPIFTGMKELLDFLREVLDRNPPKCSYPTTDVTFTLDEITLHLDEFIRSLSQDMIRFWIDVLPWKRLFSLKIRTLIRLLDPSKSTSLHYERKLVQVNLVGVIPILPSVYLSQTFRFFLTILGSADETTLHFLDSILDDIEVTMSNSSSSERLSRQDRWERACQVFIETSERSPGHTVEEHSLTSWICPPEITSAPTSYNETESSIVTTSQ